MMDGVDLYGEVEAALDRVDLCTEEMHRLGAKLAEAEKRYRIAKTQRIAYERAYKGTAVSIVVDLVNGYEDIADLREQRDLAQYEYEANREALLANKKRVDVLREQLAREWAVSGAAR